MRKDVKWTMKKKDNKTLLLFIFPINNNVNIIGDEHIWACVNHFHQVSITLSIQTCAPVSIFSSLKMHAADYSTQTGSNTLLYVSFWLVYQHSVQMKAYLKFPLRIIGLNNLTSPS